MLKPIEEIIRTVEEKKTLEDYDRYCVVMYLEMLHDLMCDTSHYFGAYIESNIPQKKEQTNESNC